MRVYTVQSADTVSKLYTLSYEPFMSKSNYGFMSIRSMMGYKKMLDELSLKTKRSYIYGIDNVMWGWVSNPYPLLFTNVDKKGKDRLFVVVADIPEDEMVLSDYDKYCEFLNGEKKVDFFDLESDCIQCCFWGIKPEQIEMVLDLGHISDMNTPLNNLWVYDKSYIWNGSKGSEPNYSLAYG